MPVLKDKSIIERFYLPSTLADPEDQRAWVEIDISPRRVGDLASLNGNMSPGEMGIAMVAGRIKAWNFTDDEGSTVPVNAETVSLIDIEDFTFLQGKIKDDVELSNGEKKTSFDTSQATLTPPPPSL